MSKFERFTGKVSFEVAGEPITVTYLTRDRISIASIYDCKDTKSRTEAMSSFCIEIMVRAYPNEPREQVEAFVLLNMDEFFSQFMVASGLINKDDLKKRTEEAKKAALQ